MYVKDPADDPYLSEVHRWWHLSHLSPELLAAANAGWLPRSGSALDLGCGLGTEIAWLAGRELRAIGVDHSAEALRRAARRHPEVTFVRADVRALPLTSRSIDLLIDRGCLHYLATAPGQNAYAGEAARVARPGARFLLRACATNAGQPSGITENLLRVLFASDWTIEAVDLTDLPSDTRQMPAYVCHLIRSA